MDMTMLVAGLSKKMFNNDYGNVYTAQFELDMPVQILNSKRPDLKLELQMGRVVTYVEGIGYTQGWLQGKGLNKRSGKYRYSFSV